MCTRMRTKYFLMLLFTFLVGMLLLSACTPAAVANPPVNTVIPASETPTQIEVFPTSIPTTAVPTTAFPTTQPVSDTGTAVTFGNLSLVVPQGVANGASGSEYPPLDSDDAAWWQKTPGHLQVMLGDYYVLQGKFHQPQIYVYPAQAYAELVPAAFVGIGRVNNILYGSGGPISVDQLPAVPFFNAQPVLAANIQTVSFQNGGGVRLVTQYTQGNTPVNNHELFYQFQGVTRDGAYYIIAIFPITASVLAETGEAAAALPPAGLLPPTSPTPTLTLSLVLFVGGCTAVPNQAAPQPPPGFQPLAAVDLSTQPFNEEILGAFTLEETAVTTIFYTLPNIDTTSFDLSLRGPNNESYVILHSEDYRTDKNGGGTWEKSLPAGDYQLLLTVPQTSGTLSVYWK